MLNGRPLSDEHRVVMTNAPSPKRMRPSSTFLPASGPRRRLMCARRCAHAKWPRVNGDGTRRNRKQRCTVEAECVRKRRLDRWIQRKVGRDAATRWRRCSRRPACFYQSRARRSPNRRRAATSASGRDARFAADADGRYKIRHGVNGRSSRPRARRPIPRHPRRCPNAPKEPACGCVIRHSHAELISVESLGATGIVSAGGSGCSEQPQ